MLPSILAAFKEGQPLQGRWAKRCSQRRREGRIHTGKRPNEFTNTKKKTHMTKMTPAIEKTHMTKMIPAIEMIAERGKTRPRLTRGRRMAVLVLAGLLTSGEDAWSDSPVLVALIGAGALMNSAAIAAGGDVVVAIIEAAVDVALNGDGDDPGGEESGGEADPKRRAGGGSVSSADGGGALNIGEAALPGPVRSFMDRDIELLASDKALPEGGRAVSGNATYRFDGDVKKADPKVRGFKLRDTITFRFDVANVKKAEDARLTLRVDKLLLSTKDVPQTKGHSQVQFTARQDGREIWSLLARVDQGETPKLSGLPELQSATVRREKDHLTLEELVVPIPYTAPGAKASTRVEVDVKYEGQGART